LNKLIEKAKEQPAMTSTTVLDAIEPKPINEVGRTEGSSYNASIGYLRAFIMLLVLAHHAVLAYHPFAPAPPASLAAQPRWWQAFPVVDSQRWTGFALLASFNDIFFIGRCGSGCRSSSPQQWWRRSPTIRHICKLGPGADSRATGSSGGRLGTGPRVRRGLYGCC
jgi:hypothetical protein